MISKTSNIDFFFLRSSGFESPYVFNEHEIFFISSCLCQIYMACEADGIPSNQYSPCSSRCRSSTTSEYFLSLSFLNASQTKTEWMPHQVQRLSLLYLLKHGSHRKFLDNISIKMNRGQPYRQGNLREGYISIPWPSTEFWIW